MAIGNKSIQLQTTLLAVLIRPMGLTDVVRPVQVIRESEDFKSETFYTWFWQSTNPGRWLSPNNSFFEIENRPYFCSRYYSCFINVLTHSLNIDLIFSALFSMENTEMLNSLSLCRISMKKINIQYRLTRFAITFVSSFSRGHHFSIRTLCAGSCSVASFAPCVRRAGLTNQCRIKKLSRNTWICKFKQEDKIKQENYIFNPFFRINKLIIAVTKRLHSGYKAVKNFEILI